MADAKLHITSAGTLSIPEASVLYYNDTRDVVSRGTEAIVYRAQLAGADSADFAVRVAYTRESAQRLQEEFQLLLDMAGQTKQGIPPVALAKHPDNPMSVLVMPFYDTYLTDVIQSDLRRGDFLSAEKQAIQAAIDYTTTMDALRALQPPRSCINHKTADFVVKEDELVILDWQALVTATPDSFASEVSLFGQVWHALFLERYGNQPLYPFNDDRWQSPYAPASAEGVVSIGLRLILSIAIQAPPEKRFSNGGTLKHNVLRESLMCWQRLLGQSADAVSIQGTWALSDFIESLPEPVPGVKQEAIWHDLVWRVNQQAGYDDETLLQKRADAVAAVQVQFPDVDEYTIRQNTFVATGEYPMVVTDITTPDQLQQFKEAVLSGNYDSASWLYHHILREAANDIERDWIQRELDPYSRYKTFMLHYNDEAVLLSTPLPVIIASAEPIINDTRIEDKSALYEVIMQVARIGYARLEEANRLRTWHTVQAAQGAYRVFVSGSRARSVIDRIRPLYPDEISFWDLETLLKDYEAVHKIFMDLFRTARTQPLRRLGEDGTTGPLDPQQATETLQIIQQALEAGIDMSDILESDEETRRQWQEMIDNALSTLQQLDRMQQDVTALQAGIERADALADDVKHLRRKLEGADDDEGLIWAVADLSKRLNDLLEAPGDTREQLTEDMKHLRNRLSLLEDQVTEQSEDMDRLSNEKVARVQRLLDDVKERFETVETQIDRSRKHEAGVLQDYLDWVNRQPIPSSVEGVLEVVDELVYALRRCPVDAYDGTLHNAWLAAFEKLRERFDDLSEKKPGRLRGRRRRKYAERRQRMAERLNACQDEAIAHYQGYLHVTGKRDS